MMEFRLICEGQTDHAVIKNILFGYFSDPDLIIKALQPVDEIECWLLPLHYADNTKAAVTNCLFKLNQQLAKDNEKTIPRGKEGSVSIYRKISKPYMKNKVLMNKYHQNPSFKIFIENELQTKIPLIDKENTASV